MKRQWLINLRLERNLFQRDIARMVGVTSQFYSYIETGDRNPSILVAKKIAKVLNFPWTMFFEDKNSE